MKLTLLCDVALPPCGKADHHNANPHVLHLDADAVSLWGHFCRVLGAAVML